MARFTTRPVVRGRRGAVTSGHYLATAAGFRILEAGGNAVDAAAATCLCLNLLEPHMNGLGGEVPTLIYSAKERKAFAVSGMGRSPGAATIDWFRDHEIDLIPGDGFLPACVPSVIGTWTEALARFGTMPFAEVAAPAIDLAENGFPVDESLHGFLEANEDRFTDVYPTTGAVYLPGGKTPAVGEVLRCPEWAGVLKKLCEAEQCASGGGRTAGLEAVRRAFYEGEIPERIVEFITRNPVPDATGKEHTGLLSVDDFAGWRASLEEPVAFNYRGLDVHKCPPWCQGPVFLQQLALLEGFDLQGMGHNSAEYIHTVIECAKLAFADREAWYGDPEFDDVPLDALLSGDYNEARRALVTEQASREMRPGDPGRGFPEYATRKVRDDNRAALGIDRPLFRDLSSADPHASDTTHLDTADAEGNMVSATPSGGWLASSPVIPGLGFPLGTRAQMFYLNPARPNALAPGKRPRCTLTPSLVTKDGEPVMIFGTPGGDNQDQWTLQFFLNHVEFGMNLQEAIDVPTFHSAHFPSSFYPRKAYPGRLVAEERIGRRVLDELRDRGHAVAIAGPWSNGKVTAIRVDRVRRVISAAASPRGHLAYAMAW